MTSEQDLWEHVKYQVEVIAQAWNWTDAVSNPALPLWDFGLTSPMG